MIKIRQLKIEINNKNLIKNLNLKAENGLFLIYGPSGTGKTSLLKAIASINKNYKGNIETKGSFGFFWQDFNLLPGTGKENILFFAGKIDYNLAKNLKINFLDKEIENLSSGEKERIAFLKSISHKPNILLLDELGNSLNTELKKIVIKEILEYSQKNIVFWISHDLEIVSSLKKESLVYDGNFKIYKIKND